MFDLFQPSPDLPLVFDRHRHYVPLVMLPVFVRQIGGVLLLNLLVGSVQAAPAKSIRLRHLLPVPAIETKAQTAAAGLVIVQFRAPPKPEWRAQLQSLGVELLRYVPDDAFVARLESADVDEIQALDFIQFVGAYQPGHKLDPRLAQAASASATAKTAAPAAELKVSILLAPRAAAAAVTQAKSRLLRLEQETSLRSGRILRGSISPAQLNALAASHDVLWIEPAPTMKLNDEVSSRIVAGDGPPGQTLMQSLGYDGTGVTVAVADSGLDSGDTNFMHLDIQDRVRALFHYGAPGQLEDAADEHSHGTHCAGIIAGNGATGTTDENGFLYGLGVAPGASLIGQRLFDAAGGYAPPPSFERMTRDAKRAGADIGSNSWGDDTQGRYDLTAMEFDELVRDADALAFGDQPYILEFSAGNAGPNYQSVGTPAVAKNVIATGASQNERFNLPLDEFAIYAEGRDAMADFSSRGPCEDGRIKPDLVAPGTWIASLRSIYANDNFAWWPISFDYLYQGGTSQAGPQVSGAAAVFVQYWRSNYSGLTPSPALVKAALINSAADMDDGFTTDAVPNNDEGWGRVDLPALIASTRDYDFTDQTTLLTNGGVFEKRVLIGSADEPLKITLAYTDEPGLPAAVIALVNDLDLEVIAPDGHVYRGNQFENGESIPAAPLPDSINNVEAVHLFAPVPGEYIVRVRGSRVVEDARRDSVPVDQDFALVISGRFAAPGTGIVTFDRRVYRAPDQIKLALVDYDLAGQPTANLLLRSGAEPAGELLALQANGSGGVFTGAVATVFGAAVADGVLQVAHNNVIEAVYADALPPVNRIFTALADLQPPVISSVRATNQFGQIVILWNTDEAARGEVYYGISAPNLALTNRTLDVEQEFALSGLPADAVVKFFVVSQDEAGNRSTNDNAGSFFTVTNIQLTTVLLLDSYTDFGGLIPAPPLSGYTTPLNALGASFDVFDARGGNLPNLAQLQSYRCVIWRMDELISPGLNLVNLLAAYVTNGGSLFVASMEAVTRLGEAGAASFASNILQVQSNTEDVPVNDIIGFGGDPVGAGINVSLDYEENYGDLLFILSGGGITDPSDWIVPTTNATPVLLADGQIVGLRAPKTGVDLPGRVVFLSFPLDAVPLDGTAGNNRAGLLQNALNFLAPPANTSTLTLDSDVYAVPRRAIVEVEDADMRGQGLLSVNVHSPQHSNQTTLSLSETVRGGLFRGSLIFVPTNTGAPGTFFVNANDSVTLDYFDASAGQTVSATVTIETNAPIVSDVHIEPGYLEAIVSWSTSKPADSFVQYSESPITFPINFTAHDPSLATYHEVFLNGLKPNTTYYVRVSSRDRAGNTATDDNNGQLYTFTTLPPLLPPWSDDLETPGVDWSTYTPSYSENGWEHGAPGGGETARSPVNCWGSNLGGGPRGICESLLISPGIALLGGNKATLRFWHNYDFMLQSEFDIIEGGIVAIITNVLTAPIPITSFQDDATFGWEEVELDLTPYLGHVVYVVWHYALGSLDFRPHLGWLVDDVSITMETIVPGTIQITNNLWQSVFALSGPTGRTSSGRSTTITNAPPGEYLLEFGDVPHYQTPPPQTTNLPPGGAITFTGLYTFADANTNGIPDGWEAQHFGAVSPQRTDTTDTDTDGLSDWAEFVAGTDPNNPPPPFQLTATALSPQLVQLAWPSVTNHTYRLHASSNGVTWTVHSPWIPATGTNTARTLGLATNGPLHFFRAEAAPDAASPLAGLFRLTATVTTNQQIQLIWPSSPGHGYRLLTSTNAANWAPATDWIRASGFATTRTLPAPTNTPTLFRLEAQP